MKPEALGKPFVWVHAKAYRTPDDPLPGDGIAWEPVPGSDPVQRRTANWMNAQTAAFGVALSSRLVSTRRRSRSKQSPGAQGNGARPEPGSAGIRRVTRWTARRRPRCLSPFGKRQRQDSLGKCRTSYWGVVARPGLAPRTNSCVQLSTSIFSPDGKACRGAT